MPILAELVFVSRILALVSGEYPVDVVVDPSVRRVEIQRNGITVATLKGAPWRAVIDFGPDIDPQQLTAVAYDAGGNEVARDTQILNLARPPAELGLSLERDPTTGHLRATAHWQHIGEVRTKRIEIKLDGKRIGTTASVLLPPQEGMAMHVLEAEVRFADGIVVRKELVFGGQYAEQVPAELTAVLVRRGKGSRTDLGSCFRLGDEIVPAAGIERSDATVVLVRDPDSTLASKVLMAAFRSSGLTRILEDRALYGLPDVKVQVVWPVAQAVRGRNKDVVANLFERNNIVGPYGTYWMLTGFDGPTAEEYRFADALSVAGVVSLNGARRRVAVLVVGDRHDDSRHDPAVVRRYLERIGVPLRVWSLVGAKPGVVAAWGPVIDVSTPVLLQDATNDLRQELASQWIVWMPLEPLDALRVRAAPDCAFTPVAALTSRSSRSATELP